MSYIPIWTKGIFCDVWQLPFVVRQVNAPSSRRLLLWSGYLCPRLWTVVSGPSNIHSDRQQSVKHTHIVDIKIYVNIFEAEIQLPPYSIRNVQNYIPVWKYLHFDSVLYELIFDGPTNNNPAFVPNRRRLDIWTNDCLVHRGLCSPLGLNELIIHVWYGNHFCKC